MGIEPLYRVAQVIGALTVVLTAVWVGWSVIEIIGNTVKKLINIVKEA